MKWTATPHNLQTQNQDAAEFVCTVTISVKKPYQVKPATESSLQTLIIKRQVAVTLDLINILFNSYYTITSPIL